MVCGPTDVGKSTLCRLLVNYAVRMGQQPIYIDLDVGQVSSICVVIKYVSFIGRYSYTRSYWFVEILLFVLSHSIPGILPVERPSSVEENEFSKFCSLVYHFGYNNPSPNLKLYETLVLKTGEMYMERCKNNSKSKF